MERRRRWSECGRSCLQPRRADGNAKRRRSTNTPQLSLPTRTHAHLHCQLILCHLVVTPGKKTMSHAVGTNTPSHAKRALSSECRHAPKRHDNSVLCPRTRYGPWQLPPHTDSGCRPRSRHFVNSPRHERTPLTRKPPAFFRTGSSVELSSTHRLYKDGHPRYQSVIDA